MKKILVTGSNGFLGKHVINHLSKYAVEIWAPGSKIVNLLNKDQLDDFVSWNKPDAILHLAAVCGGILANKNSPADFLRDNTQMGLNIYEIAREYKVPYVYSLGSVCAYPKFCPIPFKEDDIWNGAPEETNFPYGQAKRTLLMLSQTYRQQYGIRGAHLIPVNMYGAHDHFDLVNSHVIPALIKKFDDAIINNSPIVYCWGTGQASREFLHVDDAAQVITQAVMSEFDSELPINLGTGQEITIKDLTLLLKELTGFQGEVVFTNEVSDGQPRRMLNVERAKKLLNWTAKIDLKNGIRDTISWYRKHKI